MRIPLDYIGRLQPRARTVEEQERITSLYNQTREFARERKIDTSLIGKKKK